MTFWSKPNPRSNEQKLIGAQKVGSIEKKKYRRFCRAVKLLHGTL